MALKIKTQQMANIKLKQTKKKNPIASIYALKRTFSGFLFKTAV